jgi:preprotein translocase subunit SecE
MVARTDTQSSMLDTLKLWIALALLAAGVLAFYWYPEVATLYRALGLVAVAVVALAIAYTTATGQRAWAFLQDSRTELRKVVWPTRTEAVQTTLIVLLVVLLVGIFLWLLDMLLQWGFSTITAAGG